MSAAGAACDRLPFTADALLAPMEGVTDPAFRAVMLELHSPRDLGGSTTEFVRVVDHAVPQRVLERELGPVSGPIPVGMQFMANDETALRASVERAELTAAAFVDLNFGCPAKGTLRGCAGAALLRDPARIERLVAAAVSGTRRLPVTAKLRAGWDSADQLEQLVRAAEQGGAAMITLHCRTRAEGYCESVDWQRIARAVQAVRVPVCGNGGVRVHADIARLRAATGCRFVMIGRGALADPWIFSGAAATPQQAFAFLSRYMQVMRERTPQSERFFSGRVKQILSHWGPQFLSEAERTTALHERDAAKLYAWIEARSAPAPGFKAE